MINIIKQLPPLITLLIVFNAQAQMSVQPQSRSTTQGPAIFLGTWGTTAQCKAHQADSRKNQRLFPLVISNEWIKQGMIYCYLQWRRHSSLGAVTRAQALAQCGEDTLRDYLINLNLENNQLIVHWSKYFSTQALEVCKTENSD